MGFEEDAIAEAKAARDRQEEAKVRNQESAAKRSKLRQDSIQTAALEGLKEWRRKTKVAEVPGITVTTRFKWIPHSQLASHCHHPHDVIFCILGWQQEGYRFEAELQHIYNGDLWDQSSWLKPSDPVHFNNDNFAVRVFINGKWIGASSLAEIGEALLRAKGPTNG